MLDWTAVEVQQDIGVVDNLGDRLGALGAVTLIQPAPASLAGVDASEPDQAMLGTCNSLIGA